MQLLVKTTLWILIVMLALSGLLVLSGVVYLWTSSTESQRDLPYLGWLLALTIAEMVAIALMVARKGLTYLPATETSRQLADTERFMSSFLGSGSNATIVSNRLSWLTSSAPLQDRLGQLARAGVLIEVITPGRLATAVCEPLEAAGVRFFATGEISLRRQDSLSSMEIVRDLRNLLSQEEFIRRMKSRFSTRIPVRRL